MILSRRSFLKVAGLSAVAVAGASMFTGCSVNNLISTGVVYSAKVGSSITEDTIKKLNESKYTNAVPGHSDLYSNNDGKCKEAVQNQLNGAAKLNVEAAKNVRLIALLSIISGTTRARSSKRTVRKSTSSP